MSIILSSGFLGIAASTFCQFYKIYVQQLLTDAPVSVLVTTINVMKIVKNIGTNIGFPRTNKSFLAFTIAVFAYPGQTTDHCQLVYMTGLLKGTIWINSTYHTISWKPHK